VRLNVSVLSTEQALCAADCERFHFVDVAASTIVAPPGIPLGVLVCQQTAHRVEDRMTDVILGRYEVYGGRLATAFAFNKRRKSRVKCAQ
jgi:hypothetical protein